MLPREGKTDLVGFDEFRNSVHVRRPRVEESCFVGPGFRGVISQPSWEASSRYYAEGQVQQSQ